MSAAGAAVEGPTLALGLISGTSMDGVDVALVSCDADAGARPWGLAHRTFPYPRELAVRLRACAEGGTTEEVARLHVAVGEVFALAARRLLEECDVELSAVRCIGSHGQTLVHLPDATPVAEIPVRATLQIGCPAVIAARTGLVTIADFRAMDVALGGQGAPLVPLLDWRCFTHADRGRVLLNLGGIANLTALPPGAAAADVVAFDTGPANVLMDAVCRKRGVPGGFDRDGELASAGRVDRELLTRLRRHPFYEASPPKSADTRDFLDDAPFGGGDLSTIDLLATCAALTVDTVADAIERWVTPAFRPDEVLVSGGGLHNRAVLEGLRARLDAPVLPLPDESGITPAAKEAAAFAYLALRRLAGLPGNLPGATGARAEALLGAVVRPPGTSRP